MPKARTAKIASAPKFAGLLSCLCLIAFVLAVAGISSHQTRLVRFGAVQFQAEVAESAAEQKIGLSGRIWMPSAEGMIFVFREDSVHCFWMKDMRFALDIIWIDAGHKVVHVESNISPDSYPKTFCPEVPARYVLETNAGQFSANGGSIGTRILF